MKPTDFPLPLQIGGLFKALVVESMRDIDLIDFICSKRLSFVGVGSNESEVIRVFGKPKIETKWAKNQSVKPDAWAYDDLYVGFNSQTGLVQELGFSNHTNKIKEFSAGKCARLLCNGIKFGLDISEFKQKIDDYEHIVAAEMGWDESGRVIEFISGVSAWFHGTIEGETRLVEISN